VDGLCAIPATIHAMAADGFLMRSFLANDTLSVGLAMKNIVTKAR